MTRRQLTEQIVKKRSLLCIGLDTDPNKIPESLRSEADPIFAFNKAIIDATHPFAVAYKPNLAFYEAEGIRGWQSLEKTVDYLNQNYPEVFTIADAKRGDIGNTSARYAKAFFETLSFDAVTIAPYMGADSVKPFLENQRDKWVILLALTSNPGATDFQTTFVDRLLESKPEMLYQKVLRLSQNWGTTENMMFVVGATKADYIKQIREVVPRHFLLVPGVGAQGGDMEAVIKYGKTEDGGLLINASRSVIYASKGLDFAEAAAKEAKEIQQQMASLL